MSLTMGVLRAGRRRRMRERGRWVSRAASLMRNLMRRRTGGRAIGKAAVPGPT